MCLDGLWRGRFGFWPIGAFVTTKEAKRMNKQSRKYQKNAFENALKRKTQS